MDEQGLNLTSSPLSKPISLHLGNVTMCEQHLNITVFGMTLKLSSLLTKSSENNIKHNPEKNAPKYLLTFLLKKQTNKTKQKWKGIKTEMTESVTFCSWKWVSENKKHEMPWSLNAKMKITYLLRCSCLKIDSKQEFLFIFISFYCTLCITSLLCVICRSFIFCPKKNEYSRKSHQGRASIIAQKKKEYPFHFFLYEHRIHFLIQVSSSH